MQPGHFYPVPIFFILDKLHFKKSLFKDSLFDFLYTLKLHYLCIKIIFDMKKYLFLSSLILLASPATPSCATTSCEQSDELSMLVGTYTVKSKSDGIYLFHFNQHTGEAKLVTSTKIGNPSFLTYTKQPSFVYSVSEFSNAEAAANATPFDVTSETFGPTRTTLASNVDSGAEDPCNIWTNGHFLVTANYTGGSLSVFSITDGGATLKLRQFIRFQKLLETSVSHIHCARPTPDGKYLLVTDLGNDCIYRFTINSEADSKENVPFLTAQRIVYNGPLGWGPRHFVFSNDGQYVYLINELGGTIVVFRYINGNLLPVQHVLAEEVPAHGSADIHLSPDGHFLYASHRLQNDGISIYRINKANGLIHKVGYQHTALHPRNFAITPNGRFLLVASRDDNCIEVYRRNKRTGLLQNIHNNISLPKPVCIDFFK
jgi:6-phosphogluconolactonase (cycloisomerase 2 family)